MGDAPPPRMPGSEAESDEAANRKKLEADKFADSLTKKHAKALMLAAGFRPGPNVSLQHAIDTFKARQFHEVILYAVFLFCFTVSAYTQRDVLSSHLYVNSVRSVVINKPFTVVPYFKSFRNITRQGDVWGYLEKVLPDYLFEETWYNGEPFAPAERNSVLQVNHLVQAPRLRQVRVQSYKCKDGPGGVTNVFRSVPERLEQYLIDCYPEVGNRWSTEWARDEVLPGWPPGNTVKYRSGPELASDSYSSQYESYDGGGFAIDIPLNSSRAEVKKMMLHLMENKWSDSKTRAIFFDFATYHMPERFFLSVRLVFEFLAMGEVVPTASFRTMRLGFIDTSEYVSLVFDGIVHLIVCRFIYEDAERFLKLPRYWLTDLWNYLSLCMYFVFGVALFFKARFFLRSLPYVNAPPDELDRQIASFDFEGLGWIESQIWNWTALNSVLVWMRAFRYTKYANNAVAELSYAIFDSATPLVIFFFVFSLLNFAYAVSFHISFGVDVRGNTRGVTGGLGTLPASFFAQWRMLMKGGNDFSQIVLANPTLGPLLLVTYQIIGVLIGVKLPSAIISKTFSTISDHGSDDPMAKEFRKLLIRNVKRIVFKIFFWGKKTDEDLFQMERDAEHEEALHGQKRRRKRNDKDADIELVNKNFYAIEKSVKELQRTIAGMKPKVEGFCNEEVKRYEAHMAKHVEPPSTLLFGRKEAWGSRGYANNPDLSSCIPMMGNKTILPPNWKLYHGEHGDPFYYNIADDTVQWDPPVVLLAGIVPEIEEDDEDEAPTAFKTK